MYMLATIKIKIIYSLVNPSGKNKHRYPIQKLTKKKQRSQLRDNHPTQCYKRTRNLIQIMDYKHGY